MLAHTPHQLLACHRPYLLRLEKLLLGPPSGRLLHAWNVLCLGHPASAAGLARFLGANPYCAQTGDAEVKKQWDFWYNYSARHCTHGDVCARLRRGQQCAYGMRVNPVDMITGAPPSPNNPNSIHTLRDAMRARA